MAGKRTSSPTGTSVAPESAPGATDGEPDVLPEVEPEAGEPPVEVLDDPEPEVEPEAAPVAVDQVTFICDQWAGVSLHGKGIKFTDHRYSTSDPVKIGVLDAWEHARRDT
jgi:hypothetical protein